MPRFPERFIVMHDQATITVHDGNKGMVSLHISKPTGSDPDERTLSVNIRGFLWPEQRDTDIETLLDSAERFAQVLLNAVHEARSNGGPLTPEDM